MLSHYECELHVPVDCLHDPIICSYILSWIGLLRLSTEETDDHLPSISLILMYISITIFDLVPVLKMHNRHTPSRARKEHIFPTLLCYSLLPSDGRVYDVTRCVCTIVHGASFRSKAEGLINDTVTLALSAQLTLLLQPFKVPSSTFNWIFCPRAKHTHTPHM